MTTADATSASGVGAQPGLWIDSEALGSAADVSVAALPRETGGILAGWHQGTTVIVTAMLEVPDKKAGHCHYVRNYKRAQKTLDAHRRICGDDRVGYVGEWHSHPAPQPPSSVDYEALAKLTRHTIEQVALVVIVVDDGDQVTPLGAIAQRDGCEVTITDATIESRNHE